MKKKFRAGIVSLKLLTGGVGTMPDLGINNGKVIIHIRSASRIGYSDFGTNRKRIERIQSKF